MGMGGTYFDFALLSVTDGHLTEKAVGTDFADLDASLARFCQKDLLEKHFVNLSNKPLALQRLRRACEQAKMKLSQYNQARIDVNGLVEGIDYMCNISRPHFEDLCKDDIECMLNLVSYVLEETGLEKHDVHEVVLVGGLARMPLLRRSVREYFHGKVPREVLRPDHAAVLGAAVYGAVLGADIVRDGDGSEANLPPAQLQHLKLTQVSTWSTMTAGAGVESSIVDA